MAMVREAKQKIYKYDKSCRFSEKNDLIAYLQEEEAAKKIISVLLVIYQFFLMEKHWSWEITNFA